MGQDDFVTVVLQNGIEFFEAAFAVWKLGATPQPVSAKIPKAELEAILDLANPSLVVGVPRGTLEGRNCFPAGFEPDPGLSNKPLPDRTAKYAKAMTSGGSTGRSKLIVAENAGEYNDENPLKELVHWMDERPHLIP
ncbi:MAG: AMP-binding protein, partial [Candidatus Hydrogenedentes bacterium]|nr:AMP-binding protein [Candidatus Hydrogenedentota bacterium]